MLRSVKLIEEHYENAMIRHLMVIHLTGLVILEENSYDDPKHLQTKKINRKHKIKVTRVIKVRTNLDYDQQTSAWQMMRQKCTTDD